MHDLLIERRAEKDFTFLPKDVTERVTTEIFKLADDPRPHGCRKLRGSANDWRIRVGDYRVVYEIDDAAKIVRVMRVRHRSEAYRG